MENQIENYKLIEKKEKDLEIELKNKTIPNLIRKNLINRGIDSYVYIPHPLLNGHRLHVHSENPVEDTIKAIDEVNKTLIELKNLINKELGVEVKKKKRKKILKQEKVKEPEEVKVEKEITKRKRGRPRRILTNNKIEN